MQNMESLELKIAKFLRFGVVVSFTLLLIGLLLSFQYKGDPFFALQEYGKVPFLAQLKIHYFHGHWDAFISYVGLFSLISLPIIRVILTAFLFLKQKDYLLFFLALAVLLGLGLSFSLGIEL